MEGCAGGPQGAAPRPPAGRCARCAPGCARAAIRICSSWPCKPPRTRTHCFRCVSLRARACGLCLCVWMRAPAGRAHRGAPQALCSMKRGERLAAAAAQRVHQSIPRRGAARRAGKESSCVSVVCCGPARYQQMVLCIRQITDVTRRACRGGRGQVAGAAPGGHAASAPGCIRTGARGGAGRRASWRLDSRWPRPAKAARPPHSGGPPARGRGAPRGAPRPGRRAH